MEWVTLLSYIADPEGYAQKRAENHIAENQENMLYACLYHDAVWKEYQAILSDTKKHGTPHQEDICSHNSYLCKNVQNGGFWPEQRLWRLL